jgi:hypothetical protein
VKGAKGWIASIEVGVEFCCSLEGIIEEDLCQAICELLCDGGPLLMISVSNGDGDFLRLFTLQKALVTSMHFSLRLRIASASAVAS